MTLYDQPHHFNSVWNCCCPFIIWTRVANFILRNNYSVRNKNLVTDFYRKLGTFQKLDSGETQVSVKTCLAGFGKSSLENTSPSELPVIILLWSSYYVLSFVLGALINSSLVLQIIPQNWKLRFWEIKGLLKRTQSLEVVMLDFKGRPISYQILCSLKLSHLLINFSYLKSKNYYNNVSLTLLYVCCESGHF